MILAPQNPRPAPEIAAALAQGWAHLRAALRAMDGVFGAPAEIAARLVLPPALVRQLLAWLRPAEALARRLLVIEAAAAAQALPAPRRRTLTRAGKGAGPARETLVEESSRWTLRARLFRAPRRRAKERWGGGGMVAVSTRAPFGRLARGDWPPALALAERFEALIRLAVDPARAARRWALRLRRWRHPDLEGPRAPTAGPGNPLGEALETTAPFYEQARAALSTLAPAVPRSRDPPA